MPTKKTARVEDKVDEAPTIEQMVDQTTEAPTIDEIAQQEQEQEMEQEQEKPIEIPLEALPQLLFVNERGERFQMEPWRTRGEYRLRPYFGD